jgi:outer membrane receptor for ferrienterochelin and colicins
MKFYKSLLAFLLLSKIIFSQELVGNVYDKISPVSFANVMIEFDGESTVVSTNLNGIFKISDLRIGEISVTISRLGRKTKKLKYIVKNGINTLDVLMGEEIYNLDQIVVTGTKTFKRKIKSSVIVNVLDNKRFEKVQACNISEVLNFQSGVRVETDCQTCNYTQLRINGLAGGYSQILINGKAIFSPLTGLYGMEQIPSNMIDRIEVIKGGGSSLYGSSAIGGVVNLITKLPTSNNFNFGYTFRRINDSSNDKLIFGNGTVLSENRKSGATFYINNRNRESYDHNGDNFSELPILKDNTFGANFFFKPKENQKIELNFGSLHEYRYGGEVKSGAPHFSMQSEERVHDVLIGNIDYNIDFKSGKSSLLAYLAAQKTDRDHYTGIRPLVGSNDDVAHLVSPPYGTSLSTTKQLGFQFNYKYSDFIGPNLLTIGSDLFSDYVNDEIVAYNYLVDQEVNTLGFFFQSDWNFNDKLNLLSGVRVDEHSLLKNVVVSPRLSFLYNIKKNAQIRLSYSTGFRAPQAFDTDLHIAFAGGGISRINLANDLSEEKSQSLSSSLNFDYARENYIYGFTLEYFYTKLENAFYLDPSGTDNFGDLFTKRNGSEAIVKGLSIDLRMNYNKIIQFESGFTIQKSRYTEPVSYSNSLIAVSNFLKTPNSYGYGNLSYTFSDNLSSSINYIFTGKMDLVHMGGSVNNPNDKYVVSNNFHHYSFFYTSVNIILKFIKIFLV